MTEQIWNPPRTPSFRAQDKIRRKGKPHRPNYGATKTAKFKYLSSAVSVARDLTASGSITGARGFPLRLTGRDGMGGLARFQNKNPVAKAPAESASDKHNHVVVRVG